MPPPNNINEVIQALGIVIDQALTREFNGQRVPFAVVFSFPDSNVLTNFGNVSIEGQRFLLAEGAAGAQAMIDTESAQPSPAGAH